MNDKAALLNQLKIDRAPEPDGEAGVGRWIVIGLIVAALIAAVAWWMMRPDGIAVQVVRVIVYIVGLIAVLQRLGVQTTSIIAVLGAASLAVGLALQGTLSNVAAGVLLLVLRPYKVGDVIDIGGVAGAEPP